MAIATAGKSITFTAVNEKTQEWPDLREVIGVTLQGTGLTAAQRLVLRGSLGAPAVGSGTILADYVTEAATDNADLWVGRPPVAVRGLSIDNNTVAGTWVLTVLFK